MNWEQIEQQLVSSDEECRLQGLRELAQAGNELRLHAVLRALGDESWRVRKEAVNLYLSLPSAGLLAGQVVELLHAEDNAGLRNAAVEILVRLGRQALPHLLDELGCNDHDVRKFVLDILGEIADETTIPAIERMLADPDENVCAAAAENLGKLRAREAVPALLQALNTPHLLLRFTILQALSQIGAPVPVDAILALHEDKLLRKPLFDCLGRVGGSDCASLLLSGLDDPMRNVRESAAVALAQLFNRAEAQLVPSLQTLRGTTRALTLVELLDAPAPNVKHAALKLLSTVQEPRAARRLLELCDDEEFATAAVQVLITSGAETVCGLLEAWPRATLRIKSYLAYVFAESGCKEALGLLIAGLFGEDQQLRVVVLHALGRLGGVSELPTMAEFLGDTDDDVRAAAVEALVALSRRSPQTVVQRLHGLLQDESALIRCAVVQVLGRIGGQEIESALLLAMKDESAQVRSAAVRFLNGLESCGHREMMVLALTDEASEVRRQAVEGLGVCGDATLLASLGLALNDEDLWVRTAVMRALGRIGGAAAVEYVRRGLRDPVGLVVIAAIETLVALDPMLAYRELCALLGHADNDVVTTALQQLATYPSADWISASGQTLLDHWHWDVRLTAARLIAEKGGRIGKQLLEAHLLVEGEALVSEELRDLLAQLPATGQE